MTTIHQEVTCSAPVNIAVIKYWGKRNLPLNLPTNGSISVTLNQDQLRSTTTARALSGSSYGGGGDGERKVRLWLNGEEEIIKPGGRTEKCVNEIREMRKRKEKEEGLNKDGETPLSSLPLHICSENNFPTAAGLASSASGFAALTYTLAVLYGLIDPSSSSSPSSDQSDRSQSQTLSELSRLARLGSGSACRSLFGGFVGWSKGTDDNQGLDSLAYPIAPISHWSDLHALICVASDKKKGTGSTIGMQRTVETSALIGERINNIVPKRMEEMTKAIESKDWESFAKLTMKDSNNFHACCLDTEPPIFYMNDVSRAVVSLVGEINRVSEKAGEGLLAAYTFDAGPNAVVYVREKDVKKVLDIILYFFPRDDTPFEDPFKIYGGRSTTTSTATVLPEGFNKNVIPILGGGAVSRIIHTKVGDGPRFVGKGMMEESLLNEDGMPKRLKQ